MSVRRLAWLAGHHILNHFDSLIPKRANVDDKGIDEAILEAVLAHARIEKACELPLVARLLAHGMKKLDLNGVKGMTQDWIDIILKAHLLEEVNLSDTIDFPAETFNRFSELANLTTLSVMGAKHFEDKHFLNLSGTISNINVSHCSSLSNAALKNVTDCPNLSSLSMSHMNNTITQSGFLHLRRLKAQLTTLDLSYVPGLTNSSLFIINLLTSLSNLSIGFSGCTAEGVSSLNDLTKLTRLDVGYIMVSGSAPEVSALASFHELRDLCASHASLTDELALKLRVSLPHITTLSIEGCTAVTDMGVAALKALSHLSDFNLSRTKLTDIGANFLSQMHISNLNVSKCRITDLGMRKLLHISSLRSLDVSYNPRITDGGLCPADEINEDGEMVSKHWPQLTRLVCLGLAITDQSLKHIAVCRQPLRSLSIGPVRGHPDNFTDLGFVALHALGELEHLLISEASLTSESLSILNTFLNPVDVVIDRCKMADEVRKRVDSLANVTSGRDSPALGVFESKEDPKKRMRRYKSLSHVVAARVARGDIAFGDALDEALDDDSNVAEPATPQRGLSRWKSVASKLAPASSLAVEQASDEVSVFQATSPGPAGGMTVADHKRERARTGTVTTKPSPQLRGALKTRKSKSKSTVSLHEQKKKSGSRKVHYK